MDERAWSVDAADRRHFHIRERAVSADGRRRSCFIAAQGCGLVGCCGCLESAKETNFLRYRFRHLDGRPLAGHARGAAAAGVSQPRELVRARRRFNCPRRVYTGRVQAGPAVLHLQDADGSPGAG